MTNVLRLSAFGALAATIVSCGGSTSSLNSAFAGNWQGTFSNPSVSQTGTMFVTIDTGSAANGNATNTTLGVSYNFSGFIGSDGSINWAVTGGETGSLVGTLAISSTNGHLMGTVTQTFGSTSVSSNIDLAPLP